MVGTIEFPNEGMGAGAVATVVAGSTLTVAATAPGAATARITISAAVGATMSGASTAASSYANSGNKEIDFAKTAVSMVTGGLVGGMLPGCYPAGSVAVNAVASAGQSVTNSLIDKSRGEEITTKL